MVLIERAHKTHLALERDGHACRARRPPARPTCSASASLDALHAGAYVNLMLDRWNRLS